MVIDHSAVYWVLHHYHELSSGIWPDPNSQENVARRKQVSIHAPYENPCLLAGEVAARVRMCGVDGILLEEVYGINRYGIYRGVKQVAREWHISMREVGSRLNKVIWYCTDDEERGGRRREDYANWKKKVHGHSKFRRNDTIGVKRA